MTISQPLPPWLRKPLGKASELSTVQRLVRHYGIHTICEEGAVPIAVNAMPKKPPLFYSWVPPVPVPAPFAKSRKATLLLRLIQRNQQKLRLL